MRKLLLVASILFAFMNASMAGTRVKDVIKALEALGYSTTPSKDLPEEKAMGKGQVLIRNLKCFEIGGKYEKVLNHAPASGIHNWGKASAKTKQMVSKTYLDNPDFVNAYAAIEKAVGMDCSLGFTTNNSDYLSRLSRQRHYARILVDRSVLLREKGNAEGAANSIITGLKLAKRSFVDNHLVIGKLVFIAICRIYSGELEKLLEKPGIKERQLQEFSSLLSLNTQILTREVFQLELLVRISHYNDPKKREKLKTDFVSKKAEYKKYYNMVLPETNKKQEQIDAFLTQSADDYVENSFAAVFSDIVKVTPFLGNHKQPYSEIHKALEWNRELFYPMLLTSQKFLEKEYKAIAEIRLLNLGIACRLYQLKHGALPQTLAEFGDKDEYTDPFVEQPLKFKQSQKGLTLYSVGPDLKDDNGKPFSYQELTGDIVIQLMKEGTVGVHR